MTRAPALQAPRVPVPPVDVLWDSMPDEVRFVPRRVTLDRGPLGAMKVIGRHWQSGRWSITPFPGTVEGFATIGLQEAATLVARLEGRHA